MPNQPSRPHGGVRGGTLARSSLLFDGPFGRIFRAVPPADYGDSESKSLANLNALADAMLSDPTDKPKDGPDDEESGIPAAFTYFGQFVDHDLTFDPASSLQRQNDPDALVDYRTPRFDLDNLYGRGPKDQPYMYAEDEKSFLLGAPIGGSSTPDLQRNRNGRALIGDPRNDENLIVGQLQAIFQRFHNKLVKKNASASFARIQQMVRFHYQWILLYDFLPRIIAEEVLNKILPTGKDGRKLVSHNNLKFFHFRQNAFMPLEFSAAAYRFGHSMIRPGYRLNQQLLLPIFSRDGPDLRGFQAPPANSAIEWKRFIDLEELPYGSMTHKKDPGNIDRLQCAYRIDTTVVNQLAKLPRQMAGVQNPLSLAQLNLQRGWRMRLPSGQDIARAMGETVMEDAKIMIGKKKITEIGGGIFNDNCPLWTYILAETVREKVAVKVISGPKTIETCKLGPVGGRIVAETFVGLLLGDSSSFLSLDPKWTPAAELKEQGVFGLRELIAYTLK